MPAITKPNLHFDATLYTGNGGTQSITNAGGFQPDFVWVKSRSTGSTNHLLEDVIRGTKNSLVSNSTIAEVARGINAFLSNGFSFNDDASGDGNVSSQTYVGWQWKAGGAAVTNTSGSITSQVSANPTAGFSVVSYASGAAGNKTVGHGLSSTPKFIITKTRNGSSYNWAIYHASVIDAVTKFLRFTTDAIVTSSAIWGAALPTSTVFGISSGNGVEESKDCIAYCWSEVEGYSKFGSYTGNGSADGPFVYTGFRPRYVLFKSSTAAGNAWIVYDSSRNTYNVAGASLIPNDSTAENGLSLSTENTVDLLSNGFKLRTSNAGNNQSSATYIYACFAENPFKYANAR